MKLSILRDSYEEQLNYEAEDPASTAHCVDIDECRIGTSTCDVTALCINSPGSHQCQCQAGYSGDGYTCTSKSGSIYFN